jgi:hypothetical protein
LKDFGENFLLSFTFSFFSEHFLGYAAFLNFFQKILKIDFLILAYLACKCSFSEQLLKRKYFFGARKYSVKQFYEGNFIVSIFSEQNSP